MAKRAAVPDLSLEALLWKEGSAFVFGVDEAGRGCLAGPVCAAVACWAPHSAAFGPAVEVRDSKLMTEAQREAAFGPVRRLTLAHGVGFASREEIDRWNILRATHLAVARALEDALRSLVERGLVPGDLGGSPFHFLSDGSYPLAGKGRFFACSPEYSGQFPLLSMLYKNNLAEKCVVKGDSKVFSIASASVLAKVSRDHKMEELHGLYPAYEFAAHKGYSTPLHLERLRREGPCPEHRRSFSPVSEVLTLFS